MKRRFTLLTILLLSLISCSKMNNDDFNSSEEGDGLFDVSDYDIWHYFSIEDDQVVRIAQMEDDKSVVEGIESINMYGDTVISQETTNTLPTEVKSNAEWVFAVCRYKVRTNGGASTDNKGGLYTFDSSVDYDDIVAMPDDAIFEDDYCEADLQMSGEIIYEPLSPAMVAYFATDDDGYWIMPPTYLKSPTYAIKSADGERIYIVDFLSYQNPTTGYTGWATIQAKEITMFN